MTSDGAGDGAGQRRVWTAGSRCGQRTPAASAAPPGRRGAATAGRPARGRTLLGTTLFVIGFSLVFATEGLAFGGLGLVLQRHQAGVTQVLGGVTIVLGLLFAGVFDRFPIAGRIVRPVDPAPGRPDRRPAARRAVRGELDPCIGPTLSVVMSLP